MEPELDTELRCEVRECQDGWLPRCEPLMGHPNGDHETWWEPCYVCNDEAKRQPEAPDAEIVCVCDVTW